ncbi:MAG: sigma-70 family RNA polymerase sigma factor [Acidobacteriota bacterium]|nr:sigma-70 family RNA polymerase sigma factor [Acidobacteriota bacterium]
MHDLSWPDLLALIARDEDPSSAWSEVRRRISVFVIVIQRGMPALSNEDAEDIVQQALLQMKANTATLHAIRKATAPNAYLFRLMRNAAIDTVRRNSRLAPLEDRVSSTSEQFELAVDVRAAMNTLSAEEQEMVVMRFWEGLTLAQIAVAKGLPYSTVAKRFFRLIGRLRSQMQNEQ